MRILSNAVAWAVGLASVLVFVGCAGSAGYGYTGTVGIGYAGGGGYVYSEYAPPERLVEVVPPSPGPGYAWVNGYWYWDGDEYLWTRGRWDVRPSPGYVWLHHGWTYDDGRYRLMPGRWVRRGYHAPYTYVHPRPRIQYGDRYYVERRPGVRIRGDVYVAPPGTYVPRYGEERYDVQPRYVEPRRPGHVYVEPARPRVYTPPPRVYTQPRPPVHQQPHVYTQPRPPVYQQPHVYTQPRPPVYQQPRVYTQPRPPVYQQPRVEARPPAPRLYTPPPQRYQAPHVEVRPQAPIQQPRVQAPPTVYQPRVGVAPQQPGRGPAVAPGYRGRGPVVNPPVARGNPHPVHPGRGHDREERRDD